MRIASTPSVSYSILSSSSTSHRRSPCRSTSQRRRRRRQRTTAPRCGGDGDDKKDGQKKIFFAFGFGYCAIGVANQLVKKENTKEWVIVGTTRSEEKAEALNRRSDGTWCEEVFAWKSDDGEPLNEECANWLKKADVVLISTPPNGDLDLDPILSTKKVREVLENAEKRQMFIYLSSTGVYGGHRGEWVDETTEPNPDSIVAQRRLNAEKAWTEWIVNGEKKNNYKSTLRIFRLGGIYGPGRSAIDIAIKRKRERQFHEKTAGKKEAVAQSEDNSGSSRSTTTSDDSTDAKSLSPTQISRRKKMYTSRIHVADVANALVRCIENEIFREEEENAEVDNESHRVSIYNVVDDYPSSRDEAVDFAASILGYDEDFVKKKKKKKNTFTSSSETTDTNLLLPSNGEKRVKNEKLKREVLLASSSSSSPQSSASLLFPSYKEGLLAIRDGNQIPFD
jgi:nucleoside-diphosphate-sugar epimerase